MNFRADADGSGTSRRLGCGMGSGVIDDELFGPGVRTGVDGGENDSGAGFVAGFGAGFGSGAGFGATGAGVGAVAGFCRSCKMCTSSPITSVQRATMISRSV